MKIRHLLLTLLLVSSAAAYAQDGGIRGKVVSRNDRAALGNVKVVVEPAGIVVTTDAEGRFRIANLPKGDYELRFETPDYENLDIAVRVDKIEKDLRSVVMSPDVQDGIDDSVFAELPTRSRCPRRCRLRRMCSTTSPRTSSAKCVSTSAATIRSTRTST